MVHISMAIDVYPAALYGLRGIVGRQGRQAPLTLSRP